MYLAEVPNLPSVNGHSRLSGLPKTFSSPVSDYLATLDERIFAQARAFDPQVVPYIEYALQTHGKGLRPTLVLLSAQSTGGVTNDHLDLAVSVELLHLATLVHDDIIDGASQRRGKPTAVAKWGAEISVLLGDCLFAHALTVCTHFPSEIHREISQGVCEVCSGEIMQTQRRFDLSLSLEDYTKIISMKTGTLFRVPCDLAARLNKAPVSVSNALKVFGENLGIAYQIYDDCLDLLGTEEESGKTLGTDLDRGKITLPILYLLQQAQGRDHEEISEIVLHGSDEQKSKLLNLLHERGMLKKTISRLGYHLGLCRDNLKLVPSCPARESLEELPQLIEQHIDELMGS